MRPIKVAAVLSGKEKFSPYYGGAVARWTYEVYRRTPPWLVPTVVGFPPIVERPYDLPYLALPSVRLPEFLAKFPYLRRYEDKVWFWQLMPKLRECDVIHLENRPHWALLLRELGYKGKIIGHLQNSHLLHYDSERLEHLATALDCIVSCSQYIADEFILRSPGMAARSQVVFNGVNTEIFRPADHAVNNKRVFYVGRFHPEKGILPLVQAFEAVTKRHPDAELHIGGATGFGSHTETPYVREVRETAERLRKNAGAKIEFLGYIDHDSQLPGCFQQAAVAVFPSVFNEPFGMVNCEAMACGTPVVATKRGGIPEVVGDSGILVDAPDPRLLAEAINAILDNREFRLMLRQKAIERARQFDWSCIAARWAEVILKVTGGLTKETRSAR